MENFINIFEMDDGQEEKSCNKSQHVEMSKIMRKWITSFQPTSNQLQTRREMKNEFPKKHKKMKKLKRTMKELELLEGYLKKKMR